MTGEALPECYRCQFDEAGYPCRRADGRGLDYARISRAMLERARLFGGMSGELPDDQLLAPTDWASWCEQEIEDKHPEHILALAIAAIDACETLPDAAVVAAGIVENMIVRHGPRVIGDVERLASKSAKFRYVLSGIWSQNDSVDPDVWLRLAKAVSVGGVMSDSALCPRAGEGGKVLDDEAARVLLRESVTETAIALGLIERVS